MSDHTPGPWEAKNQNGHGGIGVDSANRCVATVYLGVTSSRREWGKETFDQPENYETVANARLIAAAPDLLEALKHLTNILSDDDSDYPDLGLYHMVMDGVERAGDAIRKAVTE